MSYHYFAVLSRMKHINRWGLMHNTRNENLSEHSLETAFIAHALCVINNTYLNGNLNAEKAAVLAMFHDTTEIITGDMPTPVKYDNEKIKSVYKDIEKSAAKTLLAKLPESMLPVYEEIYNSRDEYLNKIVHAADKISALIKCTEEINMGNRDFVCAQKQILDTVNSLGLREVDIFMERFFESYKLTLDEQN